MSRLKKISDLINNIVFKQFVGSKEKSVASITYDSRLVDNNTAFIAIRGLEFDGHNFIEKAIDQGAKLIVCESLPEKINEDVSYLEVSDTKKVMSEIASNYYDHADTKLVKIAITGTNGKSSTAFFVQELLNALGKKTGLIGTIHYDIGSDKFIKASHTTPESLKIYELFSQMLENGCTHCVMEVSSHALSLGRVAGITFDRALFTNLSHDHLDFHKNLDEYFEAKNLLFKDHLNGQAIVNSDDEYSKRISNDEKISYGESDKADFQITNISLSISETCFDLVYLGKIYHCKTTVLSRFNIWNITAAIATINSLGFKLSDILNQIIGLVSVPGRMEKIEKNNIISIVDYAHSPDALEKLLESAKELSAGKVILVFGCGGDRDKTKRPIMAKIAEQFADFVIISSDNPRKEDPKFIIEEIKKGIVDKKNVLTIVDRKDAIYKALSLATPNDIVVVAGKGHEDYQEINGKRYQFDDREVIRAWND
jgi:UDP-N-acetylmuramoyl-L-alanyl-D-glutamate--2,6-diaminopimelate ligase